MSGTLWLLPVALGDTPWEHYSPPATREAVCRLSLFVAENAKTARAELKRIGHPVPLRELAIEQLPETPTAKDIESLLAPLLAGHDLGLMSEAGCPAVADPGALLVRRAHELGIVVKPLVGPSSLLLALMASGLDGQRFAFHGYLPAREPERSRRIAELESESARFRQTQIFIETPLPQPRPVQCSAAVLSPENAPLPGNRPHHGRRADQHAAHRRLESRSAAGPGQAPHRFPAAGRLRWRTR